MLRLIEIVRIAFGRPNRVPLADGELDPATRRSIVATLARGNVRLQLGKYITERQLEQRRERLRRG